MALVDPFPGLAALTEQWPGVTVQAALLTRPTQARRQALAELQGRIPKLVVGSSGPEFQEGWMGALDGEPLFTVHAPQEAWSEALVVFRGAPTASANRTCPPATRRN